jgi:hypothetical protein
MREIEESNQINHFKQCLIGGVKGLLSTIPFSGSAAIGAWEGYWNSRLEDTITSLSENIEKLGKEKIDQDYIESEEFMDIFLKGLRIRQNSRSKEKARFIVDLFTESLSKARNLHFTVTLKETFLSILDQLSDNEMIFLVQFSNGKYHQKSKNDIYKIGNDLQGIALDGLLAKGILREDDTWVKHIKESILGREFIAYLKLLAQMNL